MTDTTATDPGATRPVTTSATASDAETRPGTLPEPARRGGLVISQKAVERIASYTALEVAGVLDIGSGLDSVIGRRYPKAHADVAGEHVKIQLDLAVSWPAPLAQTAQSARALVRERVELLAGLHVDAVHVTVAKVETDQAPEKRRVQ